MERKLSEGSMRGKVVTRRDLSFDRQEVEHRPDSLPLRLPTPPAPDFGQHNPTIETGGHVTFPFRFSDLPLEIFQQILLCCTEPSIELPIARLGQKASPEWLPITQVCRSWRTVSHTCPILWSMITPNLNISWADIMQQRSKPLLLDVHLRVGRRDIDDRQVTMTAYNALLILEKISHRMRSLRLDGPRDHVLSTLSNLRSSSPILSLSLNLPPWDLGAPFSIPENVFSSNASVRCLSFLADRALHAPDWLLGGLTSFKTGGKVPLLGLLDALRQMPVLECFTLLRCTAVWDENDIFPGAAIPMNSLQEFSVYTESPRQFGLLATHLTIPDAARKRLAIRTLAAPGYGVWTPWLQKLTPLYAFYARGGLKNVRISGGPRRGRFIAWTDEPHDDMARFCFELEWNGSPPAVDGVRAIEMTSPFYYLCTLCEEMSTVGVRRVLVEEDPARVVVPMGYWYRFFAQLPSVEELWLYPGTAEVLWSACMPRDSERVLQCLKRVYIIGGKLSVVPKLSRQSRPMVASQSLLGGRLSTVYSNANVSPSLSSDGLFIEINGGRRKKDGSQSLEMMPGLMALLRGGAVQSREVHLRNCEVEHDALARVCALAKVRMDCDWVLQ